MVYDQASMRSFYLVSFSVRLGCDVAGEHVKNTFLVLQFFAPHLQKRLFGRFAFQVEQVVVV